MKETVERARVWYKAKEKEERARKNSNAVNRVAVEDAAKIKASAEIQGGKIERG